MREAGGMRGEEKKGGLAGGRAEMAGRYTRIDP